MGLDLTYSVSLIKSIFTQTTKFLYQTNIPRKNKTVDFKAFS